MIEYSMVGPVDHVVKQTVHFKNRHWKVNEN